MLNQYVNVLEARSQHWQTLAFSSSSRAILRKCHLPRGAQAPGFTLQPGWRHRASKGWRLKTIRAYTAFEVPENTWPRDSSWLAWTRENVTSFYFQYEIYEDQHSPGVGIWRTETTLCILFIMWPRTAAKERARQAVTGSRDGHWSWSQEAWLHHQEACGLGQVSHLPRPHSWGAASPALLTTCGNQLN